MKIDNTHGIYRGLMETSKIEITLSEYKYLLERVAELEALEQTGVRNWGGYHQAWDRQYTGADKSIMEEKMEEIDNLIKEMFV